MWFIGFEVEQETSAPLLKKILDPPLQALQLTIDLTQMNKSFHWGALIERFHAYDITAAILVFQNISVGVELFSYVNTFFCSNNFA